LTWPSGITTRTNTLSAATKESFDPAPPPQRSPMAFMAIVCFPPPLLQWETVPKRVRQMTLQANTLAETQRALQQKLKGLMPEFEIRIKAELVYEINALKRERGAIVLGHNYMEAAVYHGVADIIGDSLELSRRAASTTCDPIIFCGVAFMAETAKILNPERTVLLPAKEAGCSLAASITADDVRALKARYPGVPVVTYINTYADVKAESDVCCTSGNAAKVLASLKNDTVIFLPDEYLASNVAAESGKRIIFPSKPGGASGNGASGLIGWHGRCEVHERFTVEDIRSVRKQFPDVVVAAHPECSPEVVQASDFSGSTTRMVEFVKSSNAAHYLLLTECAMGDNIIAENPDKDVLRLCSIRCPHMQQITLEGVLHALRHNEQRIEVPEEIRLRARRAVERMLEIG
jgi:quinolinate synthase